MSILIKGMEMPKSCEVCELVSWNDEDGLVCPLTGVMALNIGRQDACPLVPVPPHGRLIDADALEVIGYRGIPQGYEDNFDSGVMWLAERIDKLPTIIPAEGEE